MPNLSRRGFLAGLGATVIAAPAIVQAVNIMPVRQRLVPIFGELGRYEGLRFTSKEALTAEDIRRVVEELKRNQEFRLGEYEVLVGGKRAFLMPCPPRKPRLWGNLEQALNDPDYVARETIL